MATPSRIAALGHYQPARVLTNEELTRMVDTSDEWIRSRVGIEQRRIAAPEERVADLAAAAAAKALAASGLDAADIGMVVVSTTTAENACPNTAALVARKLGLPGPAALDVNTACSGFPHALAVADHAIRAGAARHALVIGAEKLSAVTDWSDRSTCVLLGDGAGAVVLSAGEEGAPDGIGPVMWGSVPEMSDAVVIDGEPARFSQQGQAVFRWAVTELPRIAREVCARSGITPEELDVFVPHQANLRIVEPVARALGLTERQVVARDVVESGNTSAASIPLALSKLVEAGRVPEGGRALLLGFGGGMTWAGTVVRLP
ncbi:3-oxoacyl-ACP synthase [Mangrovactinospora gilvigrisea]|uniref:Beta-ketoacyl-[acyl-carrier-protein] synthase III n=1 Tax=Mangrovactinospora gilvigrisea TaxID=1428644 RepID=A0A1J7BSB1_9ACTN|nr:beta-ketoacyl-ACP synthase III [Mangrovactinospora gilvigrisea]OIV36345.1 3-oxoacyl-ACP synthase [Mangrovactinospora gilvigrisea]